MGLLVELVSLDVGQEACPGVRGHRQGAATAVLGVADVDRTASAPNFNAVRTAGAAGRFPPADFNAVGLVTASAALAPSHLGPLHGSNHRQLQV